MPQYDTVVPGVGGSYEDVYNSGTQIDDGEIKDQNVQSGMGEGTGSVGYEVIPVVPQESTKINTNWFDQLCDSLSSVFGG